jgi:hypothetical protein
MNVYVGVDVQIHIFLTYTLVGGEWSATRPGRFNPGKMFQYPSERRLGEPHSRYGRRGEENILDPTRTRTLFPLVVYPIASRYTDTFIK